MMLSEALVLQVLLSQEAWERLCLTMPAAGFPTVEQLGLFRLAAWPAPMWLYQVRCALTVPLHPSYRLSLVAAMCRLLPQEIPHEGYLNAHVGTGWHWLTGEGEAGFNSSNMSNLST